MKPADVSRYAWIKTRATNRAAMARRLRVGRRMGLGFKFNDFGKCISLARQEADFTGKEFDIGTVGGGCKLRTQRIDFSVEAADFRAGFRLHGQTMPHPVIGCKLYFDLF